MHHRVTLHFLRSSRSVSGRHLWFLSHALDLPPKSSLIASLKRQLHFICIKGSYEKAHGIYLHVFSHHSSFFVLGPSQKSPVCGPDSTRSRVIRSSPCWLSTPYDNGAIHPLTDVDDLSGREMCLGAEEEAGRASSKPPKNPREDRRSFADVITAQRRMTTCRVKTQRNQPKVLTRDFTRLPPLSWRASGIIHMVT